MFIEKEIENRVAEIKAQSASFCTGDIKYFIHDTGQKSSPASYTKAVLKSAFNPIPIGQANFRADEEKILFASIPVKRTIVSTVYLAIPWSHAGMYPLEEPMQLSCEIGARTPCTVIWTRNGTISSLGENDPLIKIIRNDEKLRNLTHEAILWKHICRGNI